MSLTDDELRKLIARYEAGHRSHLLYLRQYFAIATELLEARVMVQWHREFLEHMAYPGRTNGFWYTRSALEVFDGVHRDD